LYCDFLSFPAPVKTYFEYVNKLTEEIRAQGAGFAGRKVVSIFLGGGTPSILSPQMMIDIFRAIYQSFEVEENCEITIEANPGTLTPDRLEAYRACGINRISLGLQSADDNELRQLGRIHSYDEFLKSYQAARMAGFTNINVDLMSALPGQTVESYDRSLEQVLKLKPEHISAYSLIVEEGTPFYERYADHPELLPSEEDERQMYYDTKSILKKYGYDRYEISNYARPGYACRHNLGYWERTEYKGFGLGAASLLGNVRTSNQTKLSEYLQGHFAGTEEILSEQAIREEYFFLGLRKMEGVDPGIYREHYRELLKKLEEQQLIREEEGRICLTEYGIDVSNYVLAQFLEDE
jgi:oxygen-independent coproporphyrinogen-3 oxidase